MERRFRQVDVFGGAAFAGNPLAVVHDAGDLSTDEMQRLARWTNLSETAFLLPPTVGEADYRVRIFTLAHELPFAGHPTLGSCHAWLEAGGRPRREGTVIQECGAGLVRVARGPERLAFAAPPLIRSGPVDAAHAEALARFVGLDRGEIVDLRWIDNGPGWVGLLLKDAATVLAVEADPARYDGPGSIEVGLVGPYPAGSACAFEVRALFADQHGRLREDPVTGSLNASVAQWLLSTGRAVAPYVASQGTRIGFAGRPHVSQDADGTVWVGGDAVTRVEGRITLRP